MRGSTAGFGLGNDIGPAIRFGGATMGSVDLPRNARWRWRREPRGGSSRSVHWQRSNGGDAADRAAGKTPALRKLCAARPAPGRLTPYLTQFSLRWALGR